jgi:hypothetical protein
LHQTGAPGQQVEATGGQSLGTQASGNAVYCFDVQIQAAAGEFAAGQIEGASQDALTGHGADEGCAVAVIEAEGGQFGIEATAGRATAVARAPARAAVESSNPENQAAKQTDTARARLALAQGTLGLG